MMNKKGLSAVFFLFLIPALLCSEPSWLDKSSEIDPCLHDVVVFGEEDTHYYRLLLFRGGYEHISVKIIVQKYLLDFDDMENPYKLESAVRIGELENAYNLNVEEIRLDRENFLIRLNGINTYLLQDVEVELLIHQDLSYKVFIAGED